MRNKTYTFTLGLLAVLSLIISGCATSPDVSDGTRAKTYAKRAQAARSTSPAKHTLAKPEHLPDQVTIPFRTHGEHIFVSTDLNGRDAGLFLLDTGAAIDAVGMGIAGRLNLPRNGGGTAMGIAGPEKFAFRTVDSVKIGDVDLNREKLAAINLNRFNKSMGVTINGVIGYSSLKAAPFTLDYPNSQLVFYHPGEFTPPNDASRHPLLVRRGLPLVKAEVEDGTTIWLIVDSGADQELTLPMSYLKRNPSIVSVPMSGTGQSAGVGGKVKNVRTWLKRMELLGVELKNVPVSFESSPALQHSSKIVVGRIGHRLLENFSLTFDTNSRSIYAKWQPNARNELAITQAEQTPNSTIGIRYQPPADN
ncbi:aspartyl protease family protein [Poriferisphaera corsica]|nr:aspartyl protease family protein [Poriferisphaera corsica]